jgi:hypothetical protein
MKNEDWMPEDFDKFLAQTHTEVLEFISTITKFDEHGDITNLFTKGYCYGFALMLKQQFKSGQIYWDKYNAHAIFKLGHNYYDIRGSYYPQNDNMLQEVTVDIVEKEFRY